MNLNELDRVEVLSLQDSHVEMTLTFLPGERLRQPGVRRA